MNKKIDMNTLSFHTTKSVIFFFFFPEQKQWTNSDWQLESLFQDATTIILMSN